MIVPRAEEPRSEKRESRLHRLINFYVLLALSCSEKVFLALLNHITSRRPLDILGSGCSAFFFGVFRGEKEIKAVDMQIAKMNYWSGSSSTR
jgi:hypothetical protein